jgi:hypothetical protein
VKFIRRNGKVIPIGAAVRTGARVVKKTALKAAKGGSLALSGAQIASAARTIKKNPKQDIKINQGYNALGLGLAAGAGALSAATFGLGAKGFFGGMAGSLALDVGGAAANIASVRGRGRTGERIKQAARQEARNFLVGNAVYGVGLLAFKKNRERLAMGAAKVIEFAKKALVRL